MGQGRDLFASALFSQSEFVLALQVDPEPGTGAEPMAEAKRGVAALALNDLCEARLVGTRSSRASALGVIANSVSSSARTSPGFRRVGGRRARSCDRQTGVFHLAASAVHQHPTLRFRQSVSPDLQRRRVYAQST